MAEVITANGTANKLSKRAAARARKKANKQKLKKIEEEFAKRLEKNRKLEEKNSKGDKNKKVEEHEIEYVQANDMNWNVSDELKRVFEKFATPKELTTKTDEEEKQSDVEMNNVERTEQKPFVDQVIPEENKKISKKKLKQMHRLTIAELKQLVDNPEVVEVHDANSADPKLLVHLKSYRNTVPVPSHWSATKKYLQGKRGYEKPQFELPKFIADTGISDIRQAQQERDELKRNKQRQREKMQPKTGKIDIDYQVLHDAFFRYQTKPDFSQFGNLYYEGRELEVKLKAKKPGLLSSELRRALGMTHDTSPPPWLYNFQRYGPPPSYPNLKIPGVSCPIPPGARYGFGPGEWGKPPVDEYGRPLYGDVFGTTAEKDKENAGVDRSHWGELQSEDDEEEDEDDEDDDDDEDDEDDLESGIESVSSLTSSGIETPESVQLRKDTAVDDTTTEGSDAPKTLYKVLDEKKIGVGSSAMFASQHTYVVPSSKESESEKRVAAAKSKASEQVNVALNPEDLENLDAVTLKRKYEAQLDAEKVSKIVKEDVSDVIEENRLKKRKTANKNKDKKKYKF